jgi:fructoselysine 6-kinase
MTGFDLITAGDNCIDRLTGAVTADLIGGNAVNVAVQAAGLGLRTACVTAVGPVGEAEGDRVAAMLAAKGVDAFMIERRSLPTSVTVLRVGADGNRTILTEDFGACGHWSPPERTWPALLAARHVHIGWLQDGGRLRGMLAQAGVSVSQDVSVNADAVDLGVEGLTIAFASLPEDRADEAEARATDLVSRGAGGAVVTLGAKGSLALIGGQMFRAEAVPITPVDTTGAGDAYIAGFLAARLNGADVPGAMAAAHACAATCCGHPGGFPQ